MSMNYMTYQHMVCQMTDKGWFPRSGAGRKGVLSEASYRSIKKDLSTLGHFMICDGDLNCDGYNIRYASEGCYTLFHRSHFSNQRLCTVLHIDTALEAISDQIGSGHQDIQDRAGELKASFVKNLEACQGSKECPSTKLGFNLLPAFKQDGSPCVCAVLSSSRTDPLTGDLFTVCFFWDVTDEVSGQIFFEDEDEPMKVWAARHCQDLLEKEMSSWKVDSKDALLCLQQLFRETSLRHLRNSISTFVGMRTSFYLLVKDKLDTTQSFSICNPTPNENGFLFEYVSPGFCDLYGSDPFSCLGFRCCCVCASPMLSQSTSKKVARIVNVRHDIFMKRMACLLGSVGAAHKSIKAACESGEITYQIRCLLLCHAKKDGTAFVAELSAIRRTHPATGWPYVAVLQRDVTHEISLERLQEAGASVDSIEQLLREHAGEWQSNLESMGIPPQGFECDDATGIRCLDEKVLDVWTQKFSEYNPNLQGLSSIAERSTESAESSDTTSYCSSDLTRSYETASSITATADKLKGRLPHLPLIRPTTNLYDKSAKQQLHQLCAAVEESVVV
eukprot:TRINITY_DN8656_c0_g3_i4.p1 TRINITY_DN8656_c0_g3~~TRINITY_DN8656_c0_g3_i4.p1  ORF type:complete len:560 (+),score=55.11 TRINITY_DN8656_c0_g3_i4:103-1782(+)